MQLHSYQLGERKSPAVYFICTKVMEVSYAHSLKLAQEHSLERREVGTNTALQR